MIADILKTVLNSVESDPKSWIYSMIIGGITFYIVKFYYKVKQYPNGPLPLPLVGNLLKMMRIKQNVFYEFMNLSKIYGPIYTFWLGPQPFVVITDLEIAKEAFVEKKNEIAGRPQVKLFEAIFEDGSIDVALADYGPTWESLRRVAHAAVRKYAVNEKLALLVNDVVGETIETIKKREGINKPFDPVDYIYFTVYSVLASSAFGKKYNFEDTEFKRFKFMNEEQRKLGGYVIASDFVPLIKPFIKRKIEFMNANLKEFFGALREKYQKHLKDYQSGEIRDFTDALIFAKFDSLKNEKESAPYLTDGNLAMTLSDLFSAGSDTTQFTLRWVLLYMANYPSMQTRMRKEIEEHIGDRIPVQNDKQNCHYISAFISEILRHRVIVPMAVPHKAICDVQIRKLIGLIKLLIN